MSDTVNPDEKASPEDDSELLDFQKGLKKKKKKKKKKPVKAEEVKKGGIFSCLSGLIHTWIETDEFQPPPSARRWWRRPNIPTLRYLHVISKIATFVEFTLMHRINLQLLERCFKLLMDKNPNLNVKKRHTIPPPALNRVGTRRTCWANFPQICKLLRRNNEHMQAYVLAELGADASNDGNGRLVIKGRYVPKQIESLLKKYICEFLYLALCYQAC
eukprot:844812-Amorphochlora_amoeboformis.AAC.2